MGYSNKVFKLFFVFNLLFNFAANLKSVETIENLDLFEAIKEGDVKKVNALLREKDPSVLFGKNDRSSTLHFAATLPNARILNILLNNPKIKDSNLINQKNSVGDTPLSLAIISGSKETIEVLLDQKNIDLVVNLQGNNNILHVAVKSHNPDIVELVLKKIKNLSDKTKLAALFDYFIKSTNLLGQTPLALAENDLEYLKSEYGFKDTAAKYTSFYGSEKANSINNLEKIIKTLKKYEPIEEGWQEVKIETKAE